MKRRPVWYRQSAVQHMGGTNCINVNSVEYLDESRSQESRRLLGSELLSVSIYTRQNHGTFSSRQEPRNTVYACVMSAHLLRTVLLRAMTSQEQDAHGKAELR